MVRKESTINREMTCLSHIFTKAAAWEMIEKTPFKTSLRLKENNERLRFLSDEEIPRLLNACPNYLRQIVECALHTGMRKGEILGLKWDQIRKKYE